MGSDRSGTSGRWLHRDFSYDELNRLKSASVTGYATQNFNYNAIGNIKNKTGTGTGDYVYPSSGINSYDSDGASTSRPHAVKDIPGIGSFNYDANGNLESGNGRTITWTSFDMPASISNPAQGIVSSFFYGADHQRTKQIKTDPSGNSTVYYAGAMEVEIKGVNTTIKTYWPGGLGVEIDSNTQNSDLNWTHTDRLGSVIAITNAGGDLIERLAYDAWGKRRTLSGNSTSNDIDGQVDNKGFTGHEMLDKLDLVHMNGRIYDPLVARFMSADIIIQDPEHSQSYNRYTYVWNNPINLTDPTGFETVKITMTWGDPKGVCDEKCQKEQAENAANCSEKGINCDKLRPGTYKVENNEKGRTNTIEMTGSGEYSISPYYHFMPFLVGTGQRLLKGGNDLVRWGVKGFASMYTFGAGNSLIDSHFDEIDKSLAPKNDGEAIGGIIGEAGMFFVGVAPRNQAVSAGFDFFAEETANLRGTALPDSYWIKKESLDQVTPGIRSINSVKASSSGGTYHQTAHYDEFGRRVGRTDRSHHGRGNPLSKDYHPDPHHHRETPKTYKRERQDLVNPKTGSKVWPGWFGN